MLLRALTLILVVTASTAGTAHAGVIMQTQEFGPSFGVDDTLTFDKFSKSVDLLTAVKVKLQLSISGGEVRADNDGQSPGSVFGTFGAAGDISSTDVAMPTMMLEVENDINPAVALAADNGDGFGEFDTTGPDGTVIAGAMLTDMDMVFIDLADLGDYAGGGTFDVDVFVGQMTDIMTTGGVSTQTDAVTVSGNVMVEYSVIPEPSSFAMGLCALLGMMTFTSRRPRRKVA